MKKVAAVLLGVLLLMSLAVGESAYPVKVSSPNGAPGLALAVLAAQAPDNYTYVAADTIAAEFAAAQADFIIAPVNAGARLFNAGKSTYRLAAVVTWGNLYFASRREGFQLSDLNGAEVTLFGENTINASVALFALSENGITPAKVSYLAGAANTQSLLLSDDQAIVLTAEPALTAASMKNDKITAYALNDLYQAATGFEGYAQAGLFVREATIEEHPEAVSAFLTQAEEAVALCGSDLARVAEAAVQLELLPNVKVAEKAIPRCAIRYLAAADAREQVERTAAVDLSQFGGSLPADGFYYQAE